MDLKERYMLLMHELDHAIASGDEPKARFLHKAAVHLEQAMEPDNQAEYAGRPVRRKAR